MALLVLAMMLMFSMTGHARCTWCVCKDLSDVVLQKTLDYACGAGADCVPTHPHAPCFMPDTVRAHCSYAVNSFFQKNGQAPGSCDFAGTATISLTDPSYGTCSYPATVSSAGTSTTPTPSTATPTTPATTTPSTRSPSTTTPSSSTSPSITTPYNTPPSNGMLGGFGTGTTPTGGDGINADITDNGFRLATSFLPYLVASFLSGVLL